MTKYLGQAVAILKDVSTATKRELTDAHHALQKPDMLTGISREYFPVDEENGERFPSESKRVHVTVEEMVRATTRHLARLFDATAVRDFTNGPSNGDGATADVVVDGNVLVEHAPVPYLLWLERQLDDLHKFATSLPTLDSAMTWELDDPVRGVYRSEVIETVRQVQQPRAHVLYEATEKHPAQVQAYQENVVVGKWRTVRYSGATTEQRRSEIVDRVRTVQRAVHEAREQANRTEVVQPEVGRRVLDFVFGV
jgi:hypothetical protein